MTQLITGYGCFANYLHRIGKKEDPMCKHCDQNLEDSADHTLIDCIAWTKSRGALLNALNCDMSLGSVMRAIVQTEEAWLAFATTVLLAKERCKRERQALEVQNSREQRNGRRDPTLNPMNLGPGGNS
ncbi:uncharacterized protein LOC114928110 [Nylanderia fulva]|uniref:uncharacterized protein LOC114928110 n=1 Tax=Nylanderia fulva TaxID=613905 RepID=UPI0010FBB00F|nr:uncharacterized protein LOC114928110 [Nylanderia fulva]